MKNTANTKAYFLHGKTVPYKRIEWLLAIEAFKEYK